MVVETTPCAHCPEEFGGYDVTLAVRHAEEWGQPTSTPALPTGGGFFNPSHKMVCGYEGSPLGVHHLKRGKERTVVCAAPVLLEGINPTTWHVRDDLYRCSMLNPGRDARRAIRSSEAARSKEQPANMIPMQRWSEWGGTSPLAVKHHILGAHKLVGIPAKARQLCLRLLWWKITWSGPGATAECYVCGGMRHGEGEENHTFFTCPVTAGAWERARGKLAETGVIIPRGREWLIGPRTLAPQNSTLPVMAIWRMVWVGVVWGIWRLRGAAMHEDWGPESEPAEEVIWSHATEVWKDALRVRAGALRARDQEGGEFVREVGWVWEKLVPGVRRVREDRRGGEMWVTFDDGG